MHIFKKHVLSPLGRGFGPSLIKFEFPFTNIYIYYKRFTDLRIFQEKKVETFLTMQQDPPPLNLKVGLHVCIQVPSHSSHLDYVLCQLSARRHITEYQFWNISLDRSYTFHFVKAISVVFGSFFTWQIMFPVMCRTIITFVLR